MGTSHCLDTLTLSGITSMWSFNFLILLYFEEDSIFLFILLSYNTNVQR